jgi:hypothetical protein
MPLILAIEPDKRQGSQLATVIKGLHAELVHRATAADALEALHGRVPDLVLTTSLISPRDDAALAAHLRELGAAAAHVQTVTIPVLGTAAPQRAKGGMLAALRREKPQASVTDGCAPEVFAEQVRQYLATAEEQKASVSSRIAVEPDVVEAPLAEPELVAAEAEFVAPEPIAFEAATTEVAPVVDDVPEPVTIEAANRLAMSSRLSWRCSGAAASSLAMLSRLWNPCISTTGTGGSPGMPSTTDDMGACCDSSSSACAAIGST